MSSRRPKLPVWLLDDSEAAARDTDERLYETWARRQDLPINESSWKVFEALLIARNEGWLN